MKKVILISIFFASTLFNSYSQTKQESIKELFHIMQQDSLMDKMFTSMVPMMFNQMQSQLKDSTSRKHSEEMMSTTMQTVKEITKKIINEDMVVLYDKYFTQKEINDFILFYKTPSAQKFIHVTPDIQKELMMVVMQKYVPEIQKTMQAKTDEIKSSENTIDFK